MTNNAIEKIEKIDALRSEISATILHVNGILNGDYEGYSVAMLTQLQAAKKDLNNAFNHIIKAGWSAIKDMP